MFNFFEQPWTLLGMSILVLFGVLTFRSVWAEKRKWWQWLLPVVLAGAAFAPKERAGDAACGIEPLLIVDGERKKVDPLSSTARHGRDGKENGVPAADGDGAAGLLGQLAGFDDDLMIADQD